MPRGYAGKYLEVDLSKENTREISFDEATLEAYFGGRGLAAKILLDRLGKNWAKVDPLGPENVLTVLTGPMTGIYPGTRVCCSGKSPLSNGIVGSTVGSEFASELRFSGFDGLIIKGRANSPVYILVTDEGCELREASHVWGMLGEETIKTLNAEVVNELESRKPKSGRWREPGLLYIGPAGENLVRNSAIMSKLGHAAGYGGYGAVMGSKNLKAIAVKGRGPMPDVAAPETVKILLEEVQRRLARAQPIYRFWGTGYGGYSIGAERSSEPIMNWQEEWHDEKRFGVPYFSTRFWVKRSCSDFNCIIGCMKLSCIKTGKWKGDITDTPDYELQAYCGTNFGIFSPEACIHLSSLIDNLGHSGINGANTMGFAAELYQRGILKEEDLGFELKWGDADAFDKLARLIAEREKIGDILADGTYRAAKKISEMKDVDATPYAVHVKGIEVGAHGTRSGLDMNPIGYAASPHGGDHVAIALDGYNDMIIVFYDSSVNCWFCRDDFIWDFARAVTGWEINEHKWYTDQGRRILTVQQGMLLMGGPDVFWDPDRDFDNPSRFYEPLPTGPHKGKTTDKDLVERLKKGYYEAVGWDERGVPTTETLEKLELKELEPMMKKMRK